MNLQKTVFFQSFQSQVSSTEMLGCNKAITSTKTGGFEKIKAVRMKHFCLSLDNENQPQVLAVKHSFFKFSVGCQFGTAEKSGCHCKAESHLLPPPTGTRFPDDGGGQQVCLCKDTDPAVSKAAQPEHLRGSSRFLHNFLLILLKSPIL